MSVIPTSLQDDLPAKPVRSLCSATLTFPFSIPFALPKAPTKHPRFPDTFPDPLPDTVPESDPDLEPDEDEDEDEEEEEEFQEEEEDAPVPVCTVRKGSSQSLFQFRPGERSPFSPCILRSTHNVVLPNNHDWQSPGKPSRMGHSQLLHC